MGNVFVYTAHIRFLWGYKVIGGLVMSNS